MLLIWIFVLCFNLYSATTVPIIGILTEPTDQYNFDTFIASSYVKFLETAGARVIPVWINQNRDYYERVINYTNGVLFPGGHAGAFHKFGSYGEAARILFESAKKSFDNGKPFAIWGTCLGFQVFAYAEVGIDLRTSCSVDKVGLPLNFTKDSRKSKLFQNASQEIIDILAKKNVNFNGHKFCITESDLVKYGISSSWHVLTTNTDNNNLQFISAIENRRYPFYGVQFHPEKNPFEFKDKEFPHTAEAIKATQYFTNFFVNQARLSNNQFPTIDLELKSMIYNYPQTFSAVDNNYYYQIYGFKDSDYKNLLK